MLINLPDSLEIAVTQQDVAYYLGYGKLHAPDERVALMIDESIEEMKKVFRPAWRFQDFDLTVDGENISFADLNFSSRDLSRNLKNCTKLILAGVTSGAQVDSLIRRTQMIDAAKASVMQGCGAAFAENTIEALNDYISAQAKIAGFRSRPRFSPGYGDVPLEFQKEFFRLLPLAKIGLSLMDTLIMAPEKSVTAFIGLEKIS